MTEQNKQRYARLAQGFKATVVGHGAIVIDPCLPVFVGLRPDGEDFDVRVQWPDERGPQPPIGTRVRVSPIGQIEIDGETPAKENE